eukprot:2995287-Rhodomonas_salina.1
MPYDSVAWLLSSSGMMERVGSETETGAEDGREESKVVGGWKCADSSCSRDRMLVVCGQGSESKGAEAVRRSCDELGIACPDGSVRCVCSPCVGTDDFTLFPSMGADPAGLREGCGAGPCVVLAGSEPTKLRVVDQGQRDAVKLECQAQKVGGGEGGKGFACVVSDQGNGEWDLEVAGQETAGSKPPSRAPFSRCDGLVLTLGLMRRPGWLLLQVSANARVACPTSTRTFLGLRCPGLTAAWGMMVPGPTRITVSGRGEEGGMR